MSLLELPNGQVVDVDDNAPPEVIRKLMEANPAGKKKEQPFSDDPERNEAHARNVALQAASDKFNTEHPWKSALYSLTSSLPGVSNLNPEELLSQAGKKGMLSSFASGGAKGATASFMDEIAGVLNGALHPTDFKHAYNVAKYQDQERENTLAEANPMSDMAGQLVGALMLPMGNGARAAKGIESATKGVPLLGRVGNVAGRYASEIEKAPGFVQAALTGAGQGALNGAGAANNDTLDSAGNGFMSGMVGGGLLGGALGAAQKGYRILQDVKPGAATRVAYNRIAELLDKGGITPERAALTLNRAERSGNSAAVMDLTPGLRSQAGVISRHPDVAESNNLIDFAQNRLETRPDKFNTAVERVAQPSLGADADKLGQSIDASRLAQGKVDYAAASEHPLHWNDKLDELLYGKKQVIPGATGADAEQVNTALIGIRQEISRVRATTDEATQAAILPHLQAQEQQLGAKLEDQVVQRQSPSVGEAFSHAKRIAQDDQVDPLKNSWVYEGGEAPTKIRTPTMESWDYIKRGLDRRIGEAMKSGDRDTARRLSGLKNDITSELTSINPAYKEALANQRDAFQQAHALEVGQDALKRLRGPNNEARRLLAELQNMPPEHAEVARTGIIDAITGLRNSKANPGGTLSAMLRNPDQRAVLEFAAGSPQRMSQLERWLKTETEANRADVLSAPGRQSETARFMMGDSEMGKNLGQLALDGLRGFAFGGPMGGAGNAIRRLGVMSHGIGKSAEEELARILMSNGRSIPKGIQETAEFARKRKARELAVLLASGKAGQQPMSDLTGN